jgi:hypothetical protein
MKKSLGWARGQVAALYSLIVVFLIGAIALGADVAVMYMDWQHMTKVADAAAIAGGNYLAGYVFTGTPATGCSGQPDSATKAACTYAVDNGIAVAGLTLTEPTASTIQVVAHQDTQPYFFGKVLGLNTYAVSATAAAAAGGPIGTVSSGLFPVGLQCTNPCSLSNLNPGQSVSFGSKFVGGLAPGNWQFLSVDGTGASNLGTRIDYGAVSSYKIGDSIDSEPGNKGHAGPVRSGLADRLSRCASISDPCGGSNPNNIPPGDPCLVVIPAVDFHGCNGRCTMTIEGFALIYLEQSSTGTNIDGCFVKAVTASSIASSSAPGLGALQVPTLTQ